MDILIKYLNTSADVQIWNEKKAWFIPFLTTKKLNQTKSMPKWSQRAEGLTKFQELKEEEVKDEKIHLRM